jgi:exo-beta-1,3-glucanase (GH17 family)
LKPDPGLIHLILLAIVLLAVKPAAYAENANPAATISLQQKPGDLLAGESRAICYSGFRSGQHPDRGNGAVNPSDAEILEDLQILIQHDFTLIRLYDSQVNSAAVLRLITTHKLDLKVMLGAWLDAEVSNTNCPWQKEPYSEEVLAANTLKNAQEISRAVNLTNQYPNIVVALAVGNEALVHWNDHMVPVESIIRYVRQVKLAVTVPVTVADNYDWWANHGSTLAKELDFISVHIYPVWENKDIDEAMAYSIANLQAVRSALPESRIVISEAGWPTTASEFGPRADEARQKQYFQELSAWAGKMNITTLFFEAFDEDWKGNPNDPLGAEKHWGLFTKDRKPKQAMQR